MDGTFNIKKGLNVQPSSNTPSEKGDVVCDTTSGDLKTHNGSVVASIATNSNTLALTNKTIDASLNTLSNIVNSNISNSAAIAYSKLNLSSSIVNADVSNSAAIAYSKLNLALGIVNGDISASAAIAYSKLNLASSIVNDDVASGAAIAYSKLNLSTSIVNADIAAGAAIALSKLAALTASRALVSDGSGVVSASSVTSTELGYVSGVTSALQTQLNAKASSSDLTTHASTSSAVHGVSGTLVGTSDTQSLSNKRFTDAITLDEIATPSTPSSGQGKIYFKSDGSLYQLNDDGTETKVGAGSGGINYITNNDFESNVSGWSTYADAAGTSPVDGTGGSPNVTFTRTTSSPLRGTASGLLTKDAANRQGQGVSYDFTIASADKAKILNVSFDYTIASGTYALDDVYVYLYDVTNALVIQPSGYKLQAATVDLPQKHLAQFQTASNSTSYRLILHVGSTSASAYTIKMDNVVVGPQIVEYGAPVGDWTEYTPTLSAAFGTTSNVSVFYRRIGDTCQVYGKFTTGTIAASQMTISLPSGLSIDSSKISTQTGRQYFGTWVNLPTASTQLNSVSNQTGYMYFNTSRLTDLTLASRGGAPTNEFINDSSIVSSGTTMSFRFEVPILGWSSTVQMSNDTDTRVVAFEAKEQTPTGTLNTGYNITIFGTVTKDTHNAYNTSTGKYVVPVPGYYYCSGGVEISHASSAVNNVVGCAIYVNSTEHHAGVARFGSTSITRLQAQANGIIYCNVGDEITLRALSTANTPTYILDFTGSNFSIQRLSGPAAIAASEKVVVRATNPSGTPQSSATTVVYQTAAIDTHGAFNTSTGIFTAPIAGNYRISTIMHVDGTFATSSTLSTFILKNSTNVAAEIRYPSGNFTGLGNSISTIINLVAGDTIKIQVATNVTTPSWYDNANGRTQVCIEKL